MEQKKESGGKEGSAKLKTLSEFIRHPGYDHAFLDDPVSLERSATLDVEAVIEALKKAMELGPDAEYVSSWGERQSAIRKPDQS